MSHKITVSRAGLIMADATRCVTSKKIAKFADAI